MPRYAIPLFVALLLCCTARGSDDVLDGRRDPQYPAAQTEDTQAPARRLPLRLVKRTPHTETADPRAGRNEPIPMPAARDKYAADKRPPLKRSTSTAGNVTTVVFSSLAIVLGLFFFVVWLARRTFPKASASLSTEVLEVLGRSPLASRHQLQLIRLGRRLLLISVTAEGAETLTEITDADEVSHLLGLCRQNQQGSITGTFRQVLHQLGTQQASPTRSAQTASGLRELTPRS